MQCRMAYVIGNGNLPCFLPQLKLAKIKLVMRWMIGLVGEKVRGGKVLSILCGYTYDLVA